jgi:hypothetical protein
VVNWRPVDRKEVEQEGLMKKYISVQELHGELQGAISLQMLYRMLNEKKLPGYQPTGKTGHWLVEARPALAILNPNLDTVESSG